MRCSYCDIAYALPDPNCRGCGAPKTADAVRRDLDIEARRGQGPLASGDIRDRAGKPDSLLNLLNYGSFGSIAFALICLGFVLMIGPAGIIALAIFIPKMMTAWSEWNTAKLDLRDRQESSREPARAFSKTHRSFESS